MVMMKSNDKMTENYCLTLQLPPAPQSISVSLRLLSFVFSPTAIMNLIFISKYYVPNTKWQTDKVSQKFRARCVKTETFLKGEY